MICILVNVLTSFLSSGMPSVSLYVIIVNSGGLSASNRSRAGVSVLCLTALYHFGIRILFLLSTSLASNLVRSEVGSLKTPS